MDFGSGNIIGFGFECADDFNIEPVTTAVPADAGAPAEDDIIGLGNTNLVEFDLIATSSAVKSEDELEGSLLSLVVASIARRTSTLTP